MAHWDSERGKLVYFDTEPARHAPGWEIVDCGCCNGLQWGGEEPRECWDCGGSGALYHHVESGAWADYPGGPLRGRDAAEHRGKSYVRTD